MVLLMFVIDVVLAGETVGPSFFVPSPSTVLEYVGAMSWWAGRPGGGWGGVMP